MSSAIRSVSSAISGAKIARDGRSLSFEQAEAALQSREQLLEMGGSERSIARQVAVGELQRIRRGWYVDKLLWNGLWPENKHLLHIIAAHRDSRGARPIFSFESAAVLWGIRLYRFLPGRVHITVPAPQQSRSGADVMRHEGRLMGDDVVERYGMRCTSLHRTVLDLTRTLSWEQAVVCADAALRRAAVVGQEQHEDRALQWREQMREISAGSGTRGIRQARRAIEYADGRAQRPGESVSRVQLHRLGFRRVALQVPVRGPAGQDYRVDFGLEDARALGEFDGEIKYTDASMRGGLTIQEVVLAEKRREDWIRGVTQRSLARWEYPPTLHAPNYWDAALPSSASRHPAADSPRRRPTFPDPVSSRRAGMKSGAAFIQARRQGTGSANPSGRQALIWGSGGSGLQ